VSLGKKGNSVHGECLEKGIGTRSDLFSKTLPAAGQSIEIEQANLLGRGISFSPREGEEVDMKKNAGTNGLQKMWDEK